MFHISKILANLMSKEVDPLWVAETRKDIEVAINMATLLLIQMRIKRELYDWRYCSKSRDAIVDLYAYCNLKINILLNTKTAININ